MEAERNLKMLRFTLRGIAEHLMHFPPDIILTAWQSLAGKGHIRTRSDHRRQIPICRSACYQGVSSSEMLKPLLYTRSALEASNGKSLNWQVITLKGSELFASGVWAGNNQPVTCQFAAGIRQINAKITLI